MRFLLAALLLAGCTTKDLGPGIETWENLPLNERFDTVECTLWHMAYTGDELYDEVSYYDGLSEEARVYLSFYRYTEEEDDLWEIDAPVSAFDVVSWEMVEDGWTDMYGVPLNTIVIQIDLTGDTLIDDGVTSFFNEDWVTQFEEGEDIWLHAWSPTETGMESFNMYLFSYGYEDDYGYCQLY